MKKTLCILVAAICIVACLCGCDNTPAILKTAMSEGDFIYNLKTDGSGTVAILGFTEEGQQKEVIIVPDTLGGYPVSNYGIDSVYGSMGDMRSEKLKRIYFPYEIKIGDFSFQYNPNLEKIIVIAPNITLYHNKVLYPNTEGVLFSHYSNVTYLSNGNIYWTDDYDYGTKILYQPPEPERSDAIFEGWYKEPECINRWDFDVDTLPEELFDSKQHNIYQETKLYAKWNTNGNNP